MVAWLIEKLVNEAPLSLSSSCTISSDVLVLSTSLYFSCPPPSSLALRVLALRAFDTSSVVVYELIVA